MILETSNYIYQYLYRTLINHYFQDSPNLYIYIINESKPKIHIVSKIKFQYFCFYIVPLKLYSIQLDCLC